MSHAPQPAEEFEYHGETRARSLAAATALTILSPGLGYMYVGQMLKGITVNLLFLLALEGFVIVFSILKFFPLLPALVVLAGWCVFTAFAVADVRRQIDPESAYVLRGFNHWTIYAVVLVLSYVAPLLATAHFISSYLAGFEPIRSAAMYPTLQVGDVALIDKSAFRTRTPRRGDLVAVRVDDDTLVLRVVGVEGDVVRIEGETVFVNNEPLERVTLEDTALRVPSLEGEADLLAMVEENNGNRYVISISPKAFIAHSLPPTKLSAGELFVLADNRSQVPAHADERIRDSRDFGPVAIDDVEGEPLYIAWSRDDGAPNFGRVGLRAQ